MKHEKIIDKIVKCLRLSESCNPNEAASALRQAHRLMQKYQVCETDIRASLVAEKAVEASLDKAPPFWMLALVNLVADAFDCRGFVDRHYGVRSQFRFIGMGSSAEVATYSFIVLLRMLSQAREVFLEGLGKTEQTERDRRLDVFTQAWLFRITTTVKSFMAQKHVRETVDTYVQKKYGETMTACTEPAVKPEHGDYEDILSGMRAADTVSLFCPIPSKSANGFLLEATA